MREYHDFLEAKRTLSQAFLRRESRRDAVGLRDAIGFASLSLHDLREALGQNVHGVGIGRKISDDKATEELAIRFYVAFKAPKHMVPPHERLPKSIEGLPTDVIVTPPAQLAVTNRDTFRPLEGGVSSGHFQITAGTLGCFCRSTRPDESEDLFALSNNHVFANFNSASVGDALLQPGIYDGGTNPKSAVAKLARWIPLDVHSNNVVDAAIGKIIDHGVVNHEIHKLGTLSGVVAAQVGQKVRKSGRTTEITDGEITDTAVDLLIPTKIGNLFFEDQIRVDPIGGGHVAKSGDSGSVFATIDDLAAVGLLFACPGDGSYAIASHMTEVVKQLDIDLV